jgi:hypothetical protein
MPNLLQFATKDVDDVERDARLLHAEGELLPNFAAWVNEITELADGLGQLLDAGRYEFQLERDCDESRNGHRDSSPSAAL